MNATYPIWPEHLQPAGMSQAMEALERGFAQFGIDFYLIGAVARDIWLTQVYDEPARRMTKDLDLAVFIHDTAEYEALLSWLQEREGFRLTAHSAFCLLYEPAPNASRVTIDLMPFGAIADEAGTVHFTTRGVERISTVGFTEVLAGAATMITPAGQPWRVVTLPGIVILKLLAWQDRPERGKDATDIWGLLALYFDLVTEEIYTHHLDLLSEEETPDTTKLTLLVGARVLGRHLQQLVAAQPIRARLLALLDAELALQDRSPLARTMSQQGPTLATVLAALTALRAGMQDPGPPTHSNH
ncbi:nucleotidyl transferase AbiEii/AbiGii toxin family protein [Hymenobacter sp. GOD-10R]|uniref:nucleotidyl transferase AbiEii/AbiGii toxin family protein n=1 Tax=Hymenobacter sp. GOD-10R TaxID=3093922 RepID=UPI002D77EEC1|nr:nucleotidyl transferase AbiEii/AbiGii toxin family protein [Hymenobacter sp. GOD-10R]WRQ31831.1 nucleotidyl transferase AbiEii/AbiGii toxin family protein [Hymenobacter sp. GOD-10R]